MSVRSLTARLVTAVVVAMVLAVIIMSLAIVIYPGIMKWTAGAVCPDGFPDPFVVRDTESIRPGETTTTFTMYCMDEQGLVRDVGWFRPIIILFGALVVVELALFAIMATTSRRRSKPSPPAVAPPSPTPGPSPIIT
ncbi:MAG: hypothetical protein OEU32_17370 [Acidimicrobiia bacterium]|nr:hypothetical protein [Acidimicrobiia bacterium]